MGEGYVEVCKKPWQFSCWNKGDPNQPLLTGAADSVPRAGAVSWRCCLVIDGKVPDPTGGATHYYATTMPSAPKWATGAKKTLTLGHHVFFKDVP